MQAFTKGEKFYTDLLNIDTQAIMQGLTLEIRTAKEKVERAEAENTE